MVINYQPSDKIDFGAIWIYGTGNAYSLPTSSYYDVRGQLVYSAERNNQRMPAYNRLDLSVNLHKKINRSGRGLFKKGERTWSFGLYNAYSRQNPFVLRQKIKTNNERTLEQTSFLPVIPFVAYKRSF